jgi:hypothetical protein
MEHQIFFLYSISPISCTHWHSTRVWDILSLFNITHFLYTLTQYSSLGYSLSTVSVCTRNGCYWIKKEYPRLEYCVSVCKKWVLLNKERISQTTHWYSTQVWDILSLFNITHFLYTLTQYSSLGYSFFIQYHPFLVHTDTVLKSGIFFLYSISPISCKNIPDLRVLCQCVQEMGAIE